MDFDSEWSVDNGEKLTRVDVWSKIRKPLSVKEMQNDCSFPADVETENFWKL